MAGAGIYVSIPFCAQKCTYCNFQSGVFARSLRADYLRCLAAEIRSVRLPPADTLYLGGGSPSLLEAEEFDVLGSSLPSVDWREATVELAPGEATAERIAAWLRARINRVSLGVQSFDPAVARAAGRRHGPETVEDDIRRLAAAGMRSFSVDLIAGLALQTPQSWRRSLEWVARLGVGHVSVYMLERDDESRLGRELRSGGTRYRAAEVPTEGEVVDSYLLAVDRLQSWGYERYEVSNFARPGSRSLHNQKYWHMEPYIGLGSDAHSFDSARRWRNVPSAAEYARRIAGGGSPRAAVESLDARRLLEDRVLSGLRTAEGVALSAAEWQPLRRHARSLVARGWLVVQGRTARLTDEGMLFADQAVSELLDGP